MIINDNDHDVEELVEEDFPEEAPETVQYMISQVKLSKASKTTHTFKSSSSSWEILTE
jgi:hypothetical protein